MYKIGQLLTLGKKDIKYELLEYKGEYRKPSTGLRVFPLRKENIQPDGRDHAVYQLWDALNLSTAEIKTLKLPLYVWKEIPDNYVELDRLDVIDDSDEVTSLLDHKECWETGHRDNKNFHLDIINEKHKSQIDKLIDLEGEDIENEFKVGVRLKLIMKHTPNFVTRRLFKQWCEDHPEFFTKMQEYVY